MENLTGVPELDYKVLLKLDLKSLRYLSQVNTYFNRIIRSDYFWQQKVQHEFGKDVARLKPQQETFKDQYIYLENTHPNDAAENGRLDAMIWMIRDNRFMDSSTATYAVIGGNLKILKLLAEQNILPDEFVIEDEDLDPEDPIVKWYNLVITIRDGDLDALQELEDQGFVPDGHAANLAITFNQPDILIYLDTLPDQEHVDMAVYNEDYKSLEWLEEQGLLPTQYAANIAAANGNIQMLNWLESNGVLPNQRGVDLAVDMHQRAALKWLKKRGLF